jgi:hypothetical protein
MKKKLNLMIAAVALLCLFCWTIYSQKAAPAKVSWEYHVTGGNNWLEVSPKLNELGSQGWELVSVTEVGSTANQNGGSGGSVTVYLKRAK